MNNKEDVVPVPTSVSDLVDGPLQDLLPTAGPMRTAALSLYDMVREGELSEPIAGGRARKIASQLLALITDSDSEGANNAPKTN